jgi:hypothetical protein
MVRHDELKEWDDDLANARFLQDRGAEILHAAGALTVTKAPITEQSSSMHLLGTCRMGNDPATSIVDRYHRSHDLRKSLQLRRQQSRDLRPRPADDDHPGACIPRRRAHRAIGEARRDLTRDASLAGGRSHAIDTNGVLSRRPT